VRDITRAVQERPFPSVVVAALVFVSLAGLVVAASMLGWPARLFQVQNATSQVLPADADIAGWASADRDSYFVGDTIKYQVRVLYRDSRINPDFNMFERSASFPPFEKREVRESEQVVFDDVKAFTLDLVLQAVEVVPDTTYRLDPIVVYYSPQGKPATALQSLRITPQSIHVTSYYPQDVSATPLRPLKDAIDDWSGPRQAVLATSGGVLLALSGFLLWRFGRKRRTAELSEPERLWREFHALAPASLGHRAYLLSCERIFTRLLHWRTGISPGTFWAGTTPGDDAWKEYSARARQLLNKSYRPEGPAAGDVERFSALLNEALSSVVAEERLKREEEPSPFNRILQQPGVLATSATSAAVAILILTLAAQPGRWLSPDVLRYNEAVRAAVAEETIPDRSSEFSKVGEQAGIGTVKAAALYNAGTIRARLGASSTAPFGEMELLHAVFQKEEPIHVFLDDQDSIDMLLNSAVLLRQAERDLKTAVRADPHDEDTRRNLELVIKRRRAVLAAIKQLFSEDASELKQAQRDTAVDVLKTDMPDEFKEEDESKRNKNYRIFEKF
jgi:hypothetical protein